MTLILNAAGRRTTTWTEDDSPSLTVSSYDSRLAAPAEHANAIAVPTHVATKTPAPARLRGSHGALATAGHAMRGALPATGRTADYVPRTDRNSYAVSVKDHPETC